MAEQMTLLQALKRHIFGADAKAPEMMKEVRALTPEDREWFKQQFKTEMDIDIIASAAQ
jgi:hypothetical protein